MAADPHGTHEPPPTPAPDGRHDERIAWWAPLLHLTAYGLGWAHPIRGLARDQAGRPTDEPIFAAVQRWWGRCLDDVLAWGADWAPVNIEGPNLTPNRNITLRSGNPIPTVLAQTLGSGLDTALGFGRPPPSVVTRPHSRIWMRGLDELNLRLEPILTSPSGCSSTYSPHHRKGPRHPGTHP